MDTSTALLATSGAAPMLPKPGVSAAAVHKAAQDFEAFFLSQSFESMSEGVGNDELFGGGEGEKIYRSMLMQEYSKVAARSGSTGISQEVEREMLRAQEVQ